MPFEKGDTRINRKGRPVGSHKQLKTVAEVLLTNDRHPVEALWKLYEVTDSDKIKKEILVALLPYCDGKMKDKDGKIVTTPEESKQAAEETLKILKELEKDAHKKKSE